VGTALQGWVGDPVPGGSPWPVVAAALLEPEVFVKVTSDLSPADVPLWLGLAERLAEPASALCRALAEELAAAA